MEEYKTLSRLHELSGFAKEGVYGLDRSMENVERHHPFGRKGKRLLIFVYIDKWLHQEIHDKASWARVQGWLQPEFEGRDGAVMHTRKFPWKPGTLINQNLLYD